MASDGKHLIENLLSAQKLFGYKVENPRGEGLGRIEDVILSAGGGEVVCAVVSFGGVLSLGHKLFAFPWSSLTVDNPKKKVILNLDRKTLEKARGFDRDHLLDPSDWTWDDLPAGPKRPAAPERPVVAAAPVPVVAPRKQAPVASEAPPIANVAPARNGMDHWGKVWQSHGLNRS